MDHMSNFRPDSSHVAQQSRRDKLRVQQANFQLQDQYANNVQHFPLHHTQNLDLMHVRNVNYKNNTNNSIYDQTVTISEMPNYSSPNSNVDFERPNETAPQCGIWRSIGSAQQNCDINNGNEVHLSSSSLGNHRRTSREISSDQENYTHFSSPSQMYHTNASNSWMNTHAESSSHHTQGGLSLSLSSKSPSLETRVVLHVPKDLNLRPSTRGHENLLEDIVGISTYDHRHMGPLGPFTGYATILKSSKFLRPAQLLLDEICRPGHVSSIATDSNLGLCASTFHGSNEGSGDFGVGSSSCEPHLPEYQHKKAKLLCMHEEVCKKYKQYNQQMQMVVSSFETVAGLSASTPYISLAVKTVAKHFRHLKNTITDQLGSLKKSPAEDFSTPNTSTSSKLKFVEQGCQKYNNNSYGERSEMGFVDNQQVWRPQRGLPERAVSVLRAWLFEHFLHPYPTDTDKHVLANQTGLTRNQVSNWFINARVRVWKPMVEEIHMLETKSLAEEDPNEDATPSVGTNSKNTDQQPLPKLIRNNASEDVRMEGNHGKAMDVEEWTNQENRSRIEGHHHHHIQADIGGPMMGYVPYHQNGFEIGRLGSISLTLGLRQSAESAQQQQQLRQQFGGHILHDFVG